VVREEVISNGTFASERIDKSMMMILLIEKKLEPVT
jgi:hypothetical protein